MKTTLATALFLLTGALVMSTSSALKRERLLPNQRDGDCSAEYSPYCSCYDYSFGRSLSCNIISDQQFDAIRNLLSTNSYNDYLVVGLHMRENINIPRNVLGGKRANYLDFYYLRRSTPFGEIDVDAFNSTANYTTSLNLNTCNLTDFNFSFLSQFIVLEELGIYDATFDKLNDMPYLPQLTSIDLGANDFETWYTSSQTPNLESISMSFMELGANSVHQNLDEKMDSILSSMTDNFIYPKLVLLELARNTLTRIPPGAFSFPALKALSLGYTSIEKLTAGSVNKTYSNNLDSLYLNEMRLTIVDPGTFVGNFSSTRIDLTVNRMTNFPELPFRDLLQSMVGYEGYVDIYGNPIVNDCGLAWLIRDNRDLIPYVGGAIANGTSFEVLNPNEYSHC